MVDGVPKKEKGASPVPRRADGQPRGAKLCQLFASYFMPSPSRFTSRELVCIRRRVCARLVSEFRR